MEDTRGAVVRRDREGGKLNATAMDMVQERINKTTRDTESVVFMQDERSRTVRIEGAPVPKEHDRGINCSCRTEQLKMKCNLCRKIAVG